MMSVRARAHLLSYVAFPVGVFFLGILGMIAHPAVAFLAFPYMILVVSYSTRIRCPECATPVEWHTYRFLGLRFQWWSAHVPKRCEWCGHDLTGKDRKADG
jgi:hypothetical protein